MRRTLALSALVAALLVCTAPTTTHAYLTSYTLRTSSPGVMIFNPMATDFCKQQDSVSHTAMSTSAAVQELLESAYRSNGLTGNIPMGGGSPQATCTGNQCQWQWYRGLFRTTLPLMLQGVYYWGPDDKSTPIGRTTAVAGSYTNFDTNYPRSWANLSYWGKRLVVMQSSGKWINVEVSTAFTNVLCEYYVYTESDGKNRLVPTFPGGSPLPFNSAPDTVYSYCGHTLKTDSQGRLILQRCHTSFPWWAGLIIAVVCYIILVALIIAIWCCCCLRRRNAEERRRRQVIGTLKDNQGDIPAQSELGLSRQSFTAHNSYSASEASGSDSDAYSARE